MLIKSDSIDIQYVSQYIPDVINALYNPSVSESINLTIIRDAFRKKQIQSKQILFNNLLKYCNNLNDKILVIGGWLGFISFVLFKAGYSNVTEIDKDPKVAIFSKHLNRFNNNFNHFTADINTFNTTHYDIIINTSCEHINDNSWYNNLKAGTKVFLQSTNLESYDHTNLVQTIDQMRKLYPSNEIEFGEIDCGSWSRFYISGIK